MASAETLDQMLALRIFASSMSKQLSQVVGQKTPITSAMMQDTHDTALMWLMTAEHIEPQDGSTPGSMLKQAASQAMDLAQATFAADLEFYQQYAWVKWAEEALKKHWKDRGYDMAKMKLSTTRQREDVVQMLLIQSLYQMGHAEALLKMIPDDCVTNEDFGRLFAHADMSALSKQLEDDGWACVAQGLRFAGLDLRHVMFHYSFMTPEAGAPNRHEKFLRIVAESGVTAVDTLVYCYTMIRQMA
jgi:hypothetical protein